MTRVQARKKDCLNKAGLIAERVRGSICGDAILI